jgi:flagellar biogenesis protein FliO
MAGILPEPLAAVAVLGCLALALYWARRKGLTQFAGRSPAKEVQVVERVALTPQHSLFVVRAGGERLLLGVSPAGCQLLGTMPPGEGVLPR